MRIKSKNFQNMHMWPGIIKKIKKIKETKC